jgi:hypothetical protein
MERILQKNFQNHEQMVPEQTEGLELRQRQSACNDQTAALRLWWK